MSFSMLANELYDLASKYNQYPTLNMILNNCKEAAANGKYFLSITIKKDEAWVFSELLNKGFRIGNKIDAGEWWMAQVIWHPALNSQTEN